jgi:hypothetical protein
MFWQDGSPWLQENTHLGITNASCSRLTQPHRFHSMGSTIPVDAVRNSAENESAERFTAESRTTSNRTLDRFPWNRRTTSTGIRTVRACRRFVMRKAVIIRQIRHVPTALKFSISRAVSAGREFG